MSNKDLAVLIATLQERDHLSPEEIAALCNADWRFRDYPADAEVIAERSRPSTSCLLLNGIAARSMSLANGERQITGVHVLGDFVDLHGLLLRVMDHAIITLTPCQVAFIDHNALRGMSTEYPHLGRMLFMLVAIDAAIQRNWILSLGRRKAEGRLAHLFCELYLRLKVVGGIEGDSFPFPISQSTLADILGLSIVHTNRTIQLLRGANLIAWQAGRITILDWESLADLAEFDPTYLNLFHAQR